jgi:hypothetical protein
MAPGGFAATLIGIVLIGHAARWLLDRGIITSSDGGADSSSDVEASERSVDDLDAAVAAYVLSGAEGRPCRVLRDSATATAVEILADGLADIARREGDNIVIELAEAALDSHEPRHRQLVVGHLRSRSWRPSRDADRRRAVSTGTLMSNPPGRLWWARFRGAVADAALEAGLTHRRLPLLPLRALSVIGAIVVAATTLHTAMALVALDPSRLDPWLIVTGLVAARLTSDAALSSIERSDLLTARGRSLAVRLARRVEESADRADLALDADDVPPLAVAVGLANRAARQVAINPPLHDRRIWSTASGTPRVVRIARPWIPADGARPGRVALGGAAAVIAGAILRRVVSSIRDTSWINELESAVPEAFGPLDQHLDTVAAVALVPVVVGAIAAIVGAIDLVATREVAGVVIDVRLPDHRRLIDRLRSSISGAGHDGTAVVELAVDDGASDVVRPLLVDARAAAPVGATVLIRRTALLARVRSLGPTGTSGAMPVSAPNVAP